MFQDACRAHWELNCQVGGGSRTQEGGLHGMGCLLDDHHVLTACHVYAEIQTQYSWPVVLKHDGLFRGEIPWQSEEYDLMVLRVTGQIAAASGRAPAAYPVLSQELPFIRMRVGFISALHIPRAMHDTSRHTSFASADISFLFMPEGGRGESYALSGCVIQRGFSGSAVFRPDGSIMGVVIQTVSFRADFDNPSAPIYTLPVMSPLSRFRPTITALLTCRVVQGS